MLDSLERQRRSGGHRRFKPADLCGSCSGLKDGLGTGRHRHRPLLGHELRRHQRAVVLSDPQYVGGVPIELKRALGRVLVCRSKGRRGGPEPGGPHLRQVVQRISAQMLECTGWAFHPFYNGSTVLLGELVDDPLHSGSIQSLSDSTGAAR
jgi:hypothetical protein